MAEYLAIDELETGAAYEVRARNFRVAIWGGTRFHGLRHKMGQRFIDEELHYDDQGTVKPIRKLE